MCENGDPGTIKKHCFSFKGVHISLCPPTSHNAPKMSPNCPVKWSRNRWNRFFNLSWTVPETTMKIKVENVRTWQPKGSVNGPQNHLKIDEKTHLVTASAAKAHFGVPGSIWGYPPWRKRLQKHPKKRVQRNMHINFRENKHLTSTFLCKVPWSAAVWAKPTWIKWVSHFSSNGYHEKALTTGAGPAIRSREKVTF